MSVSVFQQSASLSYESGAVGSKASEQGVSHFRTTCTRRVPEFYDWPIPFRIPTKTRTCHQSHELFSAWGGSLDCTYPFSVL